MEPAIPEQRERPRRPDILLAADELEEVAERIRRHEVSRALKRMDLSSEEEEAVERLSRSLVDGLLRGPISDAFGRAGDQQAHGSAVASAEKEKEWSNNRT
jgi:glutamyl-tRNA reductase